MNDEKIIYGELINLENDLYNRTKTLVNLVSTKDISEIPIIEFRLSELFTLKSNLDVFLKINYDYSHYEFTSLISFWEEAFHELKSKIEKNDPNTSWLLERYNNYSEQHNIVDRMIRDVLDNKE